MEVGGTRILHDKNFTLNLFIDSKHAKTRDLREKKYSKKSGNKYEEDKIKSENLIFENATCLTHSKAVNKLCLDNKFTGKFL